MDKNINESLLVECAQWIYANKKRVEEEKRDVWWTPYSLTSLNTDKTNPRIPINEAFEVFLELVRRRLATHEHVVIDNKPFPVFVMMPGKDDEWKKLIKKKGVWSLHVFPFLKRLWDKGWAVFIFIIALFVTSFFGTLLEKVADDFYDTHIRVNAVTRP